MTAERSRFGVRDGPPYAVPTPLRHACRAWQQLDVPFEAARVRVLVGLACRTLGDEDTATLELEAARDAFAHLWAAPDVARVDSLAPGGGARSSHGLSPRELEVLRRLVGSCCLAGRHGETLRIRRSGGARAAGRRLLAPQSL